MLCKSCGRAFDGRPAKCPHCDAEVFYEGGEGFFDLATLELEPLPPTPDPSPEPIVEKPIINPDRPDVVVHTDENVIYALGDIQKQLDELKARRPKNSLWLGLGLAAICLAFCGLSIFITAKNAKALNDGLSAAKEELASLRIVVETTPEPVAPPLVLPGFYKMPTSETKTENDSGSVFVVEVCEGGDDCADYAPRWQKKNAEGVFIDLSEAELTRLGLVSDENDNEAELHRTFVLKAESLKQEAAGEYRCVLVIEGREPIASDPAVLAVEEKDEKAADKQGIIGTTGGTDNSGGDDNPDSPEKGGDGNAA